MGIPYGRQPASRRQTQEITENIFVCAKKLGSLVGELHEAPASQALKIAGEIYVRICLVAHLPSPAGEGGPLAVDEE